MNEQKKGSSPYFSFVIPAYNEEEHIGSCLQSIFDSDYDSTQYEVIVVDNGSQDSTYDVAVRSEKARVFELPEGNVGAVRNYGAKKARGEILVFIDADCLIDKDWLNRVKKLIRERPNCAYGGGVKLPMNATWTEKFWLLEGNGQPTLPKHLIGATTIVPKELFFQVKGFDEEVTSGEDTDLHYRLISADIPVLIEHALNITHLGNAKTVTQFIQRQTWHSENYFASIRDSLKDPVFLITLAFLALLVISIVQCIFGLRLIAVPVSLAIWAALPIVLSVKRMYRAGYFTFRPHYLFRIYLLDFLYLTGRSIGLIKGFLGQLL